MSNEYRDWMHDEIFDLRERLNRAEALLIIVQEKVDKCNGKVTCSDTMEELEGLNKDIEEYFKYINDEVCDYRKK